MSNVGKLFADVTVEPHRVYAVGATGFIDLTTGSWIQYDSAFSSETFSHEAFKEVAINA